MVYCAIIYCSNPYSPCMVRIDFLYWNLFCLTVLYLRLQWHILSLFYVPPYNHNGNNGVLCHYLLFQTVLNSIYGYNGIFYHYFTSHRIKVTVIMVQTVQFYLRIQWHILSLFYVPPYNHNSNNGVLCHYILFETILNSMYGYNGIFYHYFTSHHIIITVKILFRNLEKF
jgi:hypothetical protein